MPVIPFIPTVCGIQCKLGEGRKSSSKGWKGMKTFVLQSLTRQVLESHHGTRHSVLPSTGY